MGLRTRWDAFVRREPRDALQGTFYDPRLADFVRFPDRRARRLRERAQRLRPLQRQLPPLHCIRSRSLRGRRRQAASTQQPRAACTRISRAWRSARRSRFLRRLPSRDGTYTPPRKPAPATSRRSARRIDAVRHRCAACGRTARRHCHDARFATRGDVVARRCALRPAAQRPRTGATGRPEAAVVRRARCAPSPSG